MPLAVDAEESFLENVFSGGSVTNEPADEVVEADPIAAVQRLEGPCLVGLDGGHHAFVCSILPIRQGSLHLFQRVSTEFKSHALLDAVALDDVAALHGVG